MAQSIQSASPLIQEEEDLSFSCYKAVKEAKTDARDNLQMVNSLSNSMNNLCSSLDRLDNLMENIIFCKKGREENET